jgi:hypothetical protein
VGRYATAFAVIAMVMVLGPEPNQQAPHLLSFHDRKAVVVAVAQSIYTRSRRGADTEPLSR